MASAKALTPGQRFKRAYNSMIYTAYGQPKERPDGTVVVQTEHGEQFIPKTEDITFVD